MLGKKNSFWLWEKGQSIMIMWDIILPTKQSKVTPHRIGVLFSLHEMLAASAKNDNEQQRNAQPWPNWGISRSLLFSL